MSLNLFDLENFSPFVSLGFMATMGYDMTRKTLEHPNVQELINSDEQFDAVIVELFNTEALYGLSYHFKANLILFSTVGSHMWVNSVVGNPSPPSYIPEVVFGYSSDMTFWQRIVNVSYRVVAGLFNHFVTLKWHDDLMKKHLPDVPDLGIIQSNASIVLLNSHESINRAVPHVPNMIDIGGFHIAATKSLPLEIQSFMNNAKDGVVYFSMGSNIKPSDMPEEKKQAILKALGKLKQLVLWKWDEDSIPGKPVNVILFKWLPQQEVLGMLIITSI